MKNLILIITIGLLYTCTSSAQNLNKHVLSREEALSAKQDTFYAIQVMRTDRPDLIKPELFVEFPENALVEKIPFRTGYSYKIYFLYTNQQARDLEFNNWCINFMSSNTCIKTKKQIEPMYHLFTYD